MKTVIEMALLAGFSVKNFKPPVITARDSNGYWVSIGENLERFAQLVRAEAQAEERESCAKVCETKGAIKYAGLTIGEQCAEAIRTRSDK